MSVATALDAAAIEDLIAASSAQRCLDRPFYTDPAIFQRDADKILHRFWLYAGHVSDIPNPGDYRLTRVGESESFIVVRDERHDIHVLANVCRHRGSRICTEAQGHARKLVCPYHAWAYNLDGSLAAARYSGDEVDAAKLGLHECPTRVWQGFIFFTLADEAGAVDFDALASDLTPFAEPHDLAACKIACRRDYVVEANWKVFAENARECYHCGPAHPQYCSVMTDPAVLMSQHDTDARAQIESDLRTAREAQGLRFEPTQLTGDSWYKGRRDVTPPGVLSMAEDGRRVAPLLGGDDNHRLENTVVSIWALPSFYLGIACDHAIVMKMTPLSATRTAAEVTWLVRADAVEHEDYQVDALTWLFLHTFEQDVVLCERNQAGLSSRFYQPGPYVELEEQTQLFTTWYLNQIA